MIFKKILKKSCIVSAHENPTRVECDEDA